MRPKIVLTLPFNRFVFFQILLFCFFVFRKISVLAEGRYPPDAPVFGWGGKAAPRPAMGNTSPSMLRVVSEASVMTCKNSRTFKIFQFCSILGVFHGNLRQLGGALGCPEASWRRLRGSQSRLAGFLEGLRGVLEVSWRHLGASWGHLARFLRKMSNKC